MSGIAIAVAVIATAGASGSSQLFLITPAGLDFGQVQVGDSAPEQKVTITNISGAAVTMNGSGGAPLHSEFGGSQSCQGLTLAAGDSCTMQFRFTPTAAGVLDDESKGSWNGQPYDIKLHGEGAAPRFRVSPTALDFGPVQLGSSAPNQTVTITNIGSAPVTMNGSGGAPLHPEFGGSQSCQGLTLAVGDSCHMQFGFTPTTAGLLTDESKITWNGQPFDIQLSGTGVDTCTTASPLIGTTTLAHSAVDTNPAGLAEAFRAVATGSGTANVLCIFLDPTDTATTLVAGIYADASGHPGALLAAAKVVGAGPGTFAAVPLSPVPLAAGTPYWIAILNPSGSTATLAFRDHCCGLQSSSPTAPSEGSRETNLTSLPAQWTPGKRWPHDGPLLGWAGG